MAKRRTWWGNPALRQAIALTEGGGVRHNLILNAKNLTLNSKNLTLRA